MIKREGNEFVPFCLTFSGANVTEFTIRFQILGSNKYFFMVII